VQKRGKDHLIARTKFQKCDTSHKVDVWGDVTKERGALLQERKTYAVQYVTNLKSLGATRSLKEARYSTLKNFS
jgi:hypothetical protein